MARTATEYKIDVTKRGPLCTNIHMLIDLRLDNRRGWVRGWAKLCTCLVG